MTTQLNNVIESLKLFTTGAKELKEDNIVKISINPKFYTTAPYDIQETSGSIEIEMPVWEVLKKSESIAQDLEKIESDYYVQTVNLHTNLIEAYVLDGGKELVIMDLNGDIEEQVPTFDISECNSIIKEYEENGMLCVAVKHAKSSDFN